MVGIGAIVAWVLTLLAAISWDAASPETPTVWALSEHRRATLYSRPDGPMESSFSSPGFSQRYSVMGRSIDSEWIALRPNSADESSRPPYGWLPRDSVVMNVAVDALPVALSDAVDVISVHPDGVLGTGHRVMEKAEDVRWRLDNKLIGAGEGLWEWDPTSGSLREIDDRHWALLSPDGRWALGIDGLFGKARFVQLRIRSTSGAAEVVFEEVEMPSFLPPVEFLRWSPNSLHVSVWHAGHAEDGVLRLRILSVDGTQTLIPVGELGHWLPDSTLRAGSEALIRVLSPTGSPLGQFNLSEFEYRCRLPSQTAPQWLVPARDVNQPWQLVNLSTGTRAALTYPLDESPTSSACDGDATWKPLSLANQFVILYRTAGETETAQQWMIYDIDSGRKQTLTDDSRPPVDSGMQVLWSPGADRVALSALNGSIAIVDFESGATRTLQPPIAVGELVAWSSDGGLLLTERFVSGGEYDDRGISAFPNPHVLGRVAQFLPSDWHYREHLVLDSESGDILLRLRFDGNVCRFGEHRAMWSPDGRWLAFAGLRLPTICFLSSTFGE